MQGVVPPVDLHTFIRKFYSSRDNHNFISMIQGRGGCYRIESENLDHFWNMYCHELCHDPNFFYGLAEHPHEVQPLRADIDLARTVDKTLNIPPEQPLYTTEQLSIIVKTYQKILSEIIQGLTEPDGSMKILKSSDLCCFVLEKEKPYVNGNRIKHGFHLHFPKIWLRNCDYELYLFSRVREHLLQNHQGLFYPLVSDDHKYLDTGLTTKHWLLYGSYKSEQSGSYRLTRILDSDCKEINIVKALEEWKLTDENDDPIDLSTEQSCTLNLPRILSIHPRNRNALKIKTNLKCVMLNPPVKAKIKTVERSSNDIERYVEEAKSLMPLIGDWRANHWEDWWPVISALHEIGDGCEESLNMALTFSQRTTKDNYDEAKILYLWRSIKPNNKTIASFHYWARTDNPIAYEKWKHARAENYIEEALKGTHVYLAKMLYALFGNLYVLADMRNDRWYEFKGHRWVECLKGYTLRKKINEVIEFKFKEKIRSIYSQLSVSDDQENKAELEARIKKIEKMIYSLGISSFKSNIMKECQELFYVEDFMNKLDANINLIGFNNGVFDISEMKFRIGLPEDYISKTAGYDYDDNLTMDDTSVLDVRNFIIKLFPDPDLRRYFLEYAAQLLKGGNFNKLFLNISGERGDNGKSTLIDLIMHTLGTGKLGYAVKLPTSLVTGKRTNSSSATPELARLSGVRFGVMQEPDKRETINVGVLKELTGNDTFYARMLFQEGGDIKPQFKLALVCNKLPKLSSDDQAIWNRLLVLPCESTFPKPGSGFIVPDTEEEQLRLKIFPRDNTIIERLPKMAPAFMWLMIQTLKEIYINGQTTIPEKINKATNDYQMNNDVYLKYVTERIVIDENGTMTLTETWADFQEWFRSAFGTKQQVPVKDELKTEFLRRFGDLDSNGYWPGVKIRELSDSVADKTAIVVNTTGEDVTEELPTPKRLLKTK